METRGYACRGESIASAFFVLAGIGFTVQNSYVALEQLSFPIAIASSAGLLTLLLPFQCWRMLVPTGFSLGYGFILLGAALGRVADPFISRLGNGSQSSQNMEFISTDYFLFYEDKPSQLPPSGFLSALVTEIFNSSFTLQYTISGLLLIFCSLTAKGIWRHDQNKKYVYTNCCVATLSAILNTLACCWLTIVTAFSTFLMHIHRTFFVDFSARTFWALQPLEWNSFGYSVLGNMAVALLAAWCVVSRRPSSTASITRCLRTTLLGGALFLNLVSGLAILFGPPSFLEWPIDLIATDAIPFGITAGWMLVLLLLLPCGEMKHELAAAAPPPAIGFGQSGGRPSYKIPSPPSYRRAHGSTMPLLPTYTPVMPTPPPSYCVPQPVVAYPASYPPPHYAATIDNRRIYAI